MFFERPGLRCTKRIGKFLWLIPYRKFHDFEVVSVRPWAFGKWEVDLTCRACGARETPFGLTDGELLELGIEIPKDSTF